MAEVIFRRTTLEFTPFFKSPVSSKIKSQPRGKSETKQKKAMIFILIVVFFTTTKTKSKNLYRSVRHYHTPTKNPILTFPSRSWAWQALPGSWTPACIPRLPHLLQAMAAAWQHAQRQRPRSPAGGGYSQWNRHTGYSTTGEAGARRTPLAHERNTYTRYGGNDTAEDSERGQTYSRIHELGVPAVLPKMS